MTFDKSVVISPSTSTKDFLRWLSTEKLYGDPDDLNEYADILIKDYFKTVELLKEITENQWDKYMIPAGVKAAIKLEVKKIDKKEE